MDIRQLQIFHEVYRAKSVSKAADSLEMGQPTVSIELNKLRKHFNDPLFVRVGNSMQATAVAESLVGHITDLLDKWKRIAEFTEDFEPSVSTRKFTISMMDISHIVLLPKLVTYLHANAPSISLEIVPITPETPTLMSNGGVDLAIGFVSQLKAGFYQQTLFRQQYECLVSSNHPRIQGELSLQDYEREGHVVFYHQGTGHSILEQQIKKLGIHRDIYIQLSSFLGLGLVIEKSDLITSVPTRLSSIFATNPNLRTYPLPFESPRYTIKQHWHARFHQDAGSRWLRKIIYEFFNTAENRSLQGD
ncbi:MAG: LysR family transcriptional regulator [Alcaligenaceae bacterium]|nr:LysR family transcriptional regulator [Alcaligenaceae bacterium]